MKKLLLVALVAVGSMITSSSFAGQSKAAYMDPVLEKSLVKICKALKSNNKLRLMRAIKNSRLKPEAISEGLVCNGQDPFTFALLHSADNTASYLAKRVNKDISSMLATR